MEDREKHLALTKLYLLFPCTRKTTSQQEGDLFLTKLKRKPLTPNPKTLYNLWGIKRAIVSTPKPYQKPYTQNPKP